MIDTVSENDLLDLLVSEYKIHSFAAIAHIDSGVSIPHFPPTSIGISEESLMVIIDSTLKGDIQFKEKWVQNVYGCAYPSGRTIIGRKFVSFFDRCSTLSDLQIKGPSEFAVWQGGQGYFINEQRIAKVDDSCSMAGVSVDISKMLQIASIRIKNKSLKNSDLLIFIPNSFRSKIQFSLPEIILPVEVQIINISGKSLFHKRISNSNKIIISMKGFYSGIFCLKLESPEIHLIKQIALIK
jgi:hypothetical protein